MGVTETGRQDGLRPNVNGTSLSKPKAPLRENRMSLPRQVFLATLHHARRLVTIKAR